MKRATFSVLFYIKRTKTLKNGDVPIFVRVSVNAKNCEFAIHRSLNPGIWDNENNQASNKFKESKPINDYLEHIRFKLYEYKKELEYDNKPVTAIALRNKYCGISEDEKYVLATFAVHNNKCRELIGSGFAAGTAERYDTCYKHVKKFIELNYKQEDLPFSEIDHKFIKDFEFYLKTKKTGKCAHNTTLKYISNFKKIVLDAVANGWIKSNPFFNIKYHLDDVDMPFLTEDELNILMNKKLSNERLQQVKDTFLFCCFTGLAFIDVKTLVYGDIVEKNGEPWIKKKRQKTKNWCNVPLLEPAIKLINKYKNHPICIEKGLVFPVLSNQKMNAYLKEIADLCNINKNLSTHSARHTFATTVTLTNEMSIEAVSKMLGHSSINMTTKYARVVDDLINKNMQKIHGKYNTPM